jgi:hypothetical protein
VDLSPPCPQPFPLLAAGCPAGDQTRPIGKVTDSEAAWKLTDLSGVEVAEDGAVTGTDEAIVAAVAKYPYLTPEDRATVDDTTKALRERFPALEPSGRPMNGPHRGADPVNLMAPGAEVPGPSKSALRP